MRQALVNANPDLVAANSKYVMRITGDNEEGKAQLDNFIDPESTYPVIATTSQLMSTGVDAQTCHRIVLDKNIKSMTSRARTRVRCRQTTAPFLPMASQSLSRTSTTWMMWKWRSSRSGSSIWMPTGS